MELNRFIKQILEFGMRNLFSTPQFELDAKVALADVLVLKEVLTCSA